MRKKVVVVSGRTPELYNMSFTKRKSIYPLELRYPHLVVCNHRLYAVANDKHVMCLSEIDGEWEVFSETGSMFFEVAVLVSCYGCIYVIGGYFHRYHYSKRVCSTVQKFDLTKNA